MLAYPTKDYDSSWKAINRYRDLCLLAIRAKAGQAAQSA